MQSSLTVHLAPFSMDQLETFLEIEEPEDPLNFRAALAAEGTTVTIGQFYTAISDAIGLLSDGAFVNPAPNQVGSDLMAESVVVTNVATAQQAIATIIEQGEGTSTSPEEVVGGGYAHYYRFMQIKKGHLLVRVPNPVPPALPYAYTGVPVPYDASGAYGVPKDPLAAGYPAGSAARVACDNFNYTYTSLLLSLEAMFRGQTRSSSSARRSV